MWSFKNVTASHTDLGDQHFVTGISASDVNRDGLLDLYLATYAPAGTRKVDWAEDFLSETEQALYRKHRADDHRWLNHRGSANVLLMNRGGGTLERVPYDKLLMQLDSSSGDYSELGRQTRGFKESTLNYRKIQDLERQENVLRAQFDRMQADPNADFHRKRVLSSKLNEKRMPASVNKAP